MERIARRLPRSLAGTNAFQPDALGGLARSLAASSPSIASASMTQARRTCARPMSPYLRSCAISRPLREAAARYTSPTGLPGTAPPGPAIPVIHTARSTGACASAPVAMAGKSHFFARGRLHADALDRNAGDLGDTGTHRVAMRADARRLAHDGDVEMGDAPIPRAHALDREGQEPIGGGATPLRIGRREMHADVAVGERSEDGVHEGLKNKVGVGMSGQPTPTGDAHPAEHVPIAFAELVNIEAKTGAHIAQACEPGGLGTDEIVVGGELDVCRFTLQLADFAACPFGQLCV